jgi:hypothetical protein
MMRTSDLWVSGIAIKSVAMQRPRSTKGRGKEYMVKLNSSHHKASIADLVPARGG